MILQRVGATVAALWRCRSRVPSPLTTDFCIGHIDVFRVWALIFAYCVCFQIPDSENPTGGKSVKRYLFIYYKILETYTSKVFTYRILLSLCVL